MCQVKGFSLLHKLSHMFVYLSYFYVFGGILMIFSPSLDYSIEHLRHDDYEGVNSSCGLNAIFDIREHRVFPLACNCWRCSSCRPRKISKLLKEVVSLGVEGGLTRHLVITLKGVDFRNSVSADDSFAFSSRKFNDFRKIYKRKFGHNLSYIALPRSQKDGYCHLHILVGSYVPKFWLDKTLRSLNFGFSWITYVDIHRLKNYLSKYWYKEHEWFIPKNKRHYSCSRDVVFAVHVSDGNFVPILFGSCCDVDARLELVYKICDFFTKKPPPFDYLCSVFYSKIHDIRVIQRQFVRFDDSGYRPSWVYCSWCDSLFDVGYLSLRWCPFCGASFHFG